MPRSFGSIRNEGCFVWWETFCISLAQAFATLMPNGSNVRGGSHRMTIQQWNPSSEAMSMQVGMSSSTSVTTSGSIDEPNTSSSPTSLNWSAYSICGPMRTSMVGRSHNSRTFRGLRAEHTETSARSSHEAQQQTRAEWNDDTERYVLGTGRRTVPLLIRESGHLRFQNGELELEVWNLDRIARDRRERFEHVPTCSEQFFRCRQVL